MESSVEENSSLCDDDCRILIDDNVHVTHKGKILIDIHSVDDSDLKVKYRSVLDDLKCHLLHRKYNKLIFTTILKELKSVDRYKLKLWSNLVRSI